jgi:mxaD protein
MCNKLGVSRLLKRVLVTCCLLSTQAIGCGPSPQKVVETIIIKQTPEVVWALVGNFEKIHLWHPDVITSSTETRIDDTAKAVSYRTLILKNGNKRIDRMRFTALNAMQLGIVIEQGEMPVSNYSDALTVSPGPSAHETLVTWVGRFGNKANLMVAPEGQDNKAAIEAVEQFYRSGLDGLKATIEMMDM